MRYNKSPAWAWSRGKLDAIMGARTTVVETELSHGMYLAALICGH
jgi:hypothetical protein